MLEDARKEDSPFEDVEVEGATDGAEDGSGVNEQNEYHFPKSCYTCKARFLQRHHFYDRVGSLLDPGDEMFAEHT